jgi:hypothetical protein
MALRSKFKFNEKLRNCEIKDADHIGQFTFPVADRQGEHVRLIHEALNAFLNGKERFDTITGPRIRYQNLRRPHGAGGAGVQDR